MFDFENKLSTNVIIFKLFQNSQILKIVNANRIEKQMFTNGIFFIFIELTFFISTKDTFFMSINNTTLMYINDISFMFINVVSFMFIDDVFYTLTTTAQNAKFD